MWLFTEVRKTVERTPFGFGVWTVRTFCLDRDGTSVHSECLYCTDTLEVLQRLYGYMNLEFRRAALGFRSNEHVDST